MAYNIIVSPRAQKEIENALDFYSLYSASAPQNFIASLTDCYRIIANTPTAFRIRYKNIRALKLKIFPYSIYYTVNENANTIRVLACFHNKRNPHKRPKE